jgi:acetaldehyde dehydrogenase (acetylating)
MLHDKDLVSIQEVRTKVEKAYAAWLKFRSYTQEQVDAIVEAMAAAGRANAVRLAKWAVEETGYGNVPDKTTKNMLAADFLLRKLRGMRTVGVLNSDAGQKVVEIAVPVGVVAAILPVTNPTSTVIYKTLISVKAGNAIVIAPHPHAYRCTCGTAELMAKAAVEAGAPEDLIQCVSASTIEGTNALMKHERTAIILATGGHGIVRAAYSSGTPALGVGPGNTPVLIDRSADIASAIEKTIAGKLFDYGTVCTSEQAVVAEESLRERITGELKARKAFFCNDAQKQALARLLVTPNFTINGKCVGQPPTKIAQMAGFEIPADTSIIVVELSGVGREHPLSMEKLSPVLALYFKPDWKTCVDTCEAVMRFGGLGHTCVIYATDEARIREYAMRMPAMRVVVNTPAPQGSIGITTNLAPGMTLGCGAAAGNSTSDTIGPQHLYNVRRLAYAVRRPEEALPPAPTEDVSPQPKSVVLDRQAVASAVDRYLASRGIGQATNAAAAAASAGPVQYAQPAAAPQANVSTRASVAMEVVDRFLARRCELPEVPNPAPACKPGGG